MSFADRYLFMCNGLLEDIYYWDRTLFGYVPLILVSPDMSLISPVYQQEYQHSMGTILGKKWTTLVYTSASRIVDQQNIKGPVYMVNAL